MPETCGEGCLQIVYRRHVDDKNMVIHVHLEDDQTVIAAIEAAALHFSVLMQP